MSATELRVPQWRVLRALADGGSVPRVLLAGLAGYTSLSGTVTRALNGLREGSSSGPAHPGLIALGYVRETEVDVDGEVETCYRITSAGLSVLECQDGAPPDHKPRSACTNRRYQREE